MTDETTTTQTTGAASAPSSYEITPEVLDELARLESAATKGPWRYDDKRFGEVGSLGDTLAENVARWPENMGFLTHLRNAAPALLAAARVQEGLNASLAHANAAATKAEAERDAAIAAEARRKEMYDAIVERQDALYAREAKAERERDAAVARAEAVEKALRDLAPYHQGGKSPAGQIIADALGVPFPLRPPSKSGAPS